MRTVLIVESPAKGRKIQSFFKDDTLCIASYGHIRDLDPSCMSIDVDRNFNPEYKISQGKSKVCRAIKEYAKTCDIILAADDDREGDAIAWHCGQVANLDFTRNNRIIFHEISRPAIKKSLEEIHPINMNSVNAQQARRVIDRLVGYSLSPLLWKHVKTKTKTKGLSAGRVQSTLLTILKEHEDKISSFQGTTRLSCHGAFSCHHTHISGDSKGVFCPKSPYLPEDLLQRFAENRVFAISTQSVHSETIGPPKPLITSTLQQTSQKELHFSVKKTMSLAQKLYEHGKITYMRTDSKNMSPDFQRHLCHHIQDVWSPEDYQIPKKGATIKGAQEAHECIRVTSLDERLNETFAEDDKKLYELIKKYTIMSHMKPSFYEILQIHLETDESREYGDFLVTHRMLRYKGYLAYYDGTDRESQLSERIEIPNAMIFQLQTSRCLYEPEKPPSYYDESAIVKKLESSGIGRPSTYASILGTLDNRKYTETQTIPGTDYEIDAYSLDQRGDIAHTKDTVRSTPQKRKIVLTELGEQVLHYLSLHFSHILNVSFTSQVERDLDRIHGGQIEWTQVVKKVYESFIKDVQIQQSLSSKKSGNTRYPEPKELGEYQGVPVSLHVGPYGPYLVHKGRKQTLKYYLERSDTSVDQVTLSDILDLVKYPLSLGKYQGKDIQIHLGPYGKYLKYHKKNYKISQKDEYTREECLRIIS